MQRLKNRNEERAKTDMIVHIHLQRSKSRRPHHHLNNVLQRFPQMLCKIAKNATEAIELIEAGFEYVTGEYMDGGKLFRKRKASYLGSSSIQKGVVVQFGLRFAPGACEVRGSNPRDPTTWGRGQLLALSEYFGSIFVFSCYIVEACTRYE